MTGYRKLKSQSGFTLMEVLVALAIFGAIMVIGISVFMSIVRIQRSTSAKQSSMQDMRYIMETVSRDMKRSVPKTESNVFPENEFTLYDQKANQEIRYYVGFGIDGNAVSVADCKESGTPCALFRGVKTSAGEFVYEKMTDIAMKSVSTNLIYADGLRSALTVLVEPLNQQSFQTTISSRVPSELNTK